MFNAYECEVCYDFTIRKIGLYHILRGKVGAIKRNTILHTGTGKRKNIHVKLKGEVSDKN